MSYEVRVMLAVEQMAQVVVQIAAAVVALVYDDCITLSVVFVQNSS